MASRITIVRRDPPVSPSSADARQTGAAQPRCERCGQLRDETRRAEELRLENVRLQRRIDELEEEARRNRSAERSAASVGRRLRGEADTPSPQVPLVPATSPTEIPIADIADDERW